MRRQNTVIVVVLLNFFSLKIAKSDEFYDALKARGKFDSQTTHEVRKNTLEKKRAEEMNARTRNNPHFVPLGNSPAKKYSDAELKKWKDEESQEPETEDDRLDKIAEAKLKAQNTKDELHSRDEAGQDRSSSRDQKAKESSPAGVINIPVEKSAMKVTTEDPNEVVFEAEPPTPTPKPKRKK